MVHGVGSWRHESAVAGSRPAISRQ